MKYNRGFANIVLVIIAFLLAGVLFGFFKNSNFFIKPLSFDIANQTNSINQTDNIAPTNNYKCGLSILEPNLQSGPLMFPLSITGYINGCGWDVSNGYAGSVQVFDGDGIPVSLNTPLPLTPESKLGNLNTPSVFSATIVLTRNPSLRQGFIIFQAMPVGGLTPGSFKMPIIFAPNYAF